MPGTEGARPLPSNFWPLGLRWDKSLLFKTFSPGLCQEPRDIAYLPRNAADANGVIRRG